MARRATILIAAAPLLLAAASAPVGAEAEPIDIELRQARSEAQAAEARMRQLERAATRSRDEAARLAADRQAAAAAITAAEAQISAADAQARLAQARVAANAEQLARRQAPLAALLAGIVTIGRRPPLLNSVNSYSLDEIVRVRVLLETALPQIRRRSEKLAAQLAESRRLLASAERARAELAKARDVLEDRRERFTALEAKASERATSLGAGVIGASDLYLARAETEARIRSNTERRRAELSLAADLGDLPAAPPRPGKAAAPRPGLRYQMPVAADVLEGLGSLSDTGIRARGVRLAAFAGQEVRAPADGTIAFAGAFRSHDGVIIIDHGGGWMTLLAGVRTDLGKSDRIVLGQPLGRALGPVNVELSANGRPVSAAIIAGSSQLLFIKGKSG